MILSAACFLAARQSRAQAPVTQNPVGFVQTALTPSLDGTNRAFSLVSFPLHRIPVFSGTAASVDGNTIGFGGTLPSALTSSPCVLHVTSAANPAATGQTFLITASSSNSVTVAPNGVQIQSILAAGDSVAIRGAETLSSIFGSITSGTSSVQLQTGTTALDSDVVYIWNGGSYSSYFFYTGAWWVESSDGSYANQNNLVIYPDEAVLVGRISTNALPASYAASTGVVPTNTQTATTYAPGLTFVSNPLPIPVSLSKFGFTSSPSWQTATTANSADVVYVWQNNDWQAYYYYTGYYWVLASDGSYANQNNTMIPAGGGVLVQRRSAPSAPYNYISTALTYSVE